MTSPKLKIAFIGCVEFSDTLLMRVLQHPRAEVVGVITRAESPMNSDFKSLAPTAISRSIPVFEASKNQQETIRARIEEWHPDVTFCFGWPYLLQQDIISIPPKGTVGYHPTRLPKNRGRHPIIWTLALGLKETASTFFFMDEGADSGDILDQKALTVSPDDDASILYHRLSQIAQTQMDAIVDALLKTGYQGVPQDHTQANTWRKRDKTDGVIDWRMGTENICNLVRALTRPYPGAHCVYRGQEIKIWRCRLQEVSASNLEPGKVLASGADGIVIRCGDGIIRVTDHGFLERPRVGEYIK